MLLTSTYLVQQLLAIVKLTTTEGDLPFDCVELTIGQYCSRALKMCINDAEAASMSGGSDSDTSDASDAGDVSDASDAI